MADDTPGLRVQFAPEAGAEAVDHPEHYGGADNPYEAIKVIEAWLLGFNLGNTVKYICRAGKKYRYRAGTQRDQLKALLDDLKKARWYLDREIAKHEAEYAKKT